MKYKYWDIFYEIPKGFIFAKHIGSPLAGHVFITNGSVLKGGKLALLKVHFNQLELSLGSCNEQKIDSSVFQSQKSAKNFVFDASQARTVNELARQKFKQRLLNDILIDLTICEIEGWVKSDYIKELQNLLNGFLKKDVVKSA